MEFEAFRNFDLHLIIVVVDGVGKAKAPHCVSGWWLHKSSMTANMMNQHRKKCQQFY